MPDKGPLSVRLLGSPQVEFGGETLTVASRKSLLLICLLALRDSPLSRTEAAELLWQGGLGNVRQAVYQLRQLPGAEHWLTAGDELDIQAQTDVRLLEEAVRNGDYSGAVELWRGPFLSGLEYSDSEELQYRLDEESQRIETLYKQALTGLADQFEESGDLEQALETHEALLRADPFAELSLRQAMRLEFLLDRRALALQRFDSFARLLDTELASAPQAETARLADLIKEGNLPSELGVQALPARQRQLLGAIQIGLGRLNLDELAQVLRRDAFEVSKDVEALRKAGVIKAADDVAGARVVPVTDSDAQLLESRTARLLEERQPEDWQDQAALGWHWLRAGSGERAAGWFLKAARGALNGNALELATEYSFRASWAGTPSERFEAMLVLESLADRLGKESLQAATVDHADSLAWELQDDSALCRVRLIRARSMARKKQNSLALQHAEEAMEIAQRTGEPELLALAYNGLGVIRFGLGDLNGALESFRGSAELGVPQESMRALGNMGAIHGMREEHDTAYGLFDRALTLARSSSDLTTVSACLNNMSASAERLGAYDRALKHLHEGRQLARRLGHRSLEAQQIHNLSIIYMRQGSYGPAWNTSMEVVEEGENTSDVALHAQGLEQAADIARQCGSRSRQLELLEQAGGLLEELADQRRLVVHRAARLLAEGPQAVIPTEVKAVRELGMTSVYNWLVLEMALQARSRQDGLGLLEGIAWQGPHQAFVAELARLRMLLLDPASTEPEEGDETDSLATSIAMTMATSEFAEAPLACQLLGIVARRSGDDDGDWLQQRSELLKEQSRGLPTDLRDSLRALPDQWLASISQAGNP